MRKACARSALFTATIVIALNCGARADSGNQAPYSREEIARRLAAGYPDAVARVENNAVIFKDGSELPLDDGKGEKSLSAWLAAPDIKDMFRFVYPADAAAGAPAEGFDPGRARNQAFFRKVYGDCGAGGFSKSLTRVAWLPGSSKQTLLVSSRNGVAKHLEAVSEEFDRLPARFKRFLVPAGGGYVCRDVAGTDQRSGHGFGIAVDINVAHSHYWRWARGGPSGPVHFRNDIPIEIVRVFEKHGFIWGGRWHHYDTMHFEYRPELLPR